MRLAIFDIDGTLTNTNNVDDECFIEALAEAQGITQVNTDWAAYAHTTDSGITLQIFREKFGRTPETSELSRFKSCFVKKLSQQYQSDSARFAEIVGAAAALVRLQREADWAVAIATGCWCESALLKLTVAAIDIEGIPAAYAEDGLSREEILEAAVARALRKHALDRFEKIVSIGDGVWDVRAARRLNFAFLGVSSGDSSARLQQVGAKHLIEDFSDYHRLIELLNEAELPSPEVG